jgi:parallel beta-helix repeat protein
MELNNKDYITIDGLNVYGANTSGVLVGGGSGNFIIQNNTFEYNAEHGLWISSASDQNDGLVDTNIARYNGEMGMSFHDHFDSNTIRRNTVNNGSSVDSAHGVGIWADLVYATTGNENIIRHNLVYGNDGFGIYLEKSDYHVVHNNVLYDNADAQYTGSIGIKAAGGTTHSSNNLIYNNSISGVRPFPMVVLRQLIIMNLKIMLLTEALNTNCLPIWVVTTMELTEPGMFLILILSVQNTPTLSCGTMILPMIPILTMSLFQYHPKLIIILN